MTPRHVNWSSWLSTFTIAACIYLCCITTGCSRLNFPFGPAYVTSMFNWSYVCPAVNAIDCFKCVSLNGDNPSCEDPFHNNFTSDLLESPCMGGRKGRNGLFPATACLKLAGRYGIFIRIDYIHTYFAFNVCLRPRVFYRRPFACKCSRRLVSYVPELIKTKFPTSII